jgi:hypothetical protein
MPKTPSGSRSRPCTNEAAPELGNDVAKEILQLHFALGKKAQRDSRIQMSAGYASKWSNRDQAACPA